MSMYSPLDIDRIIRTVYGEAALEPEAGQQAVASVILNRARSSGMSPADVVMQPHQFEPWGKRRAKLEGLKTDSPIYRLISDRLKPILDGSVADPTGGADHFYSPTAQKALGRSSPSWASGQPGLDIGRHRFFKLGYGGGQPPADVPFAPGRTDDIPSGMKTYEASNPTTPRMRWDGLMRKLNPIQAAHAAEGPLGPGVGQEPAEVYPRPISPSDLTAPGQDVVKGVTDTFQRPMSDRKSAIEDQGEPQLDITPGAMTPDDIQGDTYDEPEVYEPEQRPGFFGRLRDAGIGPALTRFGAGLAAGANRGWGVGIGLGLEGAADAMDRQRALNLADKKLAMENMPAAMAYPILKEHFEKLGDPDAANKAMLIAFNPNAAETLGYGSVGKWDTQVVGESADGRKLYRQVNSVTGETRDVPGVAAGTPVVNDEDPLAGLDENTKVIVKALSQYELDPNRATSLRGNRRENLLARAKRLNPDLDLGNYANIYATRSSFQGGKDSQSLRSADQAIHHAGLLLDKFDKLNAAGGGPARSGQYGPFTELYNRGRELALGQYGSEELTGAGMPLQALASEVAKMFHGVGAVPLAEIEEILEKFNMHMTPEQQKEAITSLLQLMSGAIQSYKNKYENAVGAAYAARHPFESVFRLDPHSVAVLKRLELSPEHFGLKGDAAAGPEEFASRTPTQTPTQATAGDAAGMPKNLPPEHQELWQHYDENERAYLIKKYGG